ncbi:MAG: ribbon-helix-helix domain-containing protein [Methanocellales archaeon]|nr:ribbon-helix-helix domain-containing protein [Methanocellales archaeon]
MRIVSVSVSAKFSEKELHALDKITKERGLLNRSELIREAVRFYVSLMSLETIPRLSILRAINELFGSSGKSAGKLIEEVRAEDEI